MSTETKDTKTGGTEIVVSSSKTTDELKVNDPSPEQLFWVEQSELSRTLLKGTKGMKKAGTKFLPKNELETSSGYNNRLDRSSLLNAFRKTASFLAGQVFQSDIIFGDNVSDEVEDYSKNIDSSGNDLNVFAKRVFFNGLGKGVSLVLVTYPKGDGKEKSKSEEKELGLRPYFEEINPNNLLGGLEDEDGKLIQIRIAETIKKQKGKYGTSTVRRVKVINLGSWEIHEEDDDGNFKEIESGLISFSDEIPLVAFIPGEEYNQLYGETPLADLAELNLDHWKSNSDQKNILHVARVPILFGKNVDVSAMASSVSSMVTSTDENSDMKFVEIQGKAIESGQKDLTETESKMALYGLQQLVPRTGNRTATEKALTSSESNSSLGTWATDFQACLIKCFQLAEKYRKADFPNDGLSVNKEYSYGVYDAQELGILKDSANDKILSKQRVFNEYKRRGAIDEHADWEDNQDEIEEENRGGNNSLEGLKGTLFDDTGGSDA